MSTRIGITESNAKKFIYWVVGITAFAAVVLIGRAVTPVDKSGQLLFLSPHVAQVASYQRQAEKWVFQMSSIETDIQGLLKANTSDLFAQDRAFQDINSRSVNLASVIDSTGTPGSLGGLHDLLTEAAAAHQNAVTALGQWISEPSDETETTAEDTLAGAVSILGRIYENPWVTIDQVRESPDVTATR